MQRAFPLPPPPPPPNSPSEHLSYEYWRIRWNKLTARDQTYYKKKRTARKKTAFPSIGDSQAAIILTKHRRLNRTGRMGFWSFHYFFTKIIIFVFPPPKVELFHPNFTFLFLFHYSSSSPEKSPRPPPPVPPLPFSQKRVKNRIEVQNWFIRWEWPEKKKRKHKNVKCRPIWQMLPVQNEKKKWKTILRPTHFRDSKMLTYTFFGGRTFSLNSPNQFLKGEYRATATVLPPLTAVAIPSSLVVFQTIWVKW